MTNSTAWLDLRTHYHNSILQEDQHAYNGIRQLPYPSVQKPQMIMLVGGKTKSQTAQNVFSARTGGNNKIHLQLVPGHAESQHSLFLADCELHNAHSFRKAFASNSGEVNEHSIRWHRNIPQGFDPYTLASLVYTQVVLPFCTTLCFFADDFGGTHQVAETLSSWIISLSNRSSDLPLRSFPRILILNEWDNPAATFDEKLATIDFMQTLRQETDLRNKTFAQIKEGRLSGHDFNDLLSQQFGGLRVLPLPGRRDRGAGQQKLRSRILQESEDVQDIRQAADVAFSAYHFQSLMHLACGHFATDIVAPFSFVAAARISNPVPLGLSTHIHNFLKFVTANEVLTFGIPIIASALVLDSFPPEMHPFEPSQTFQIYDPVFEKLRSLKPSHSISVTKTFAFYCSQLSTARKAGIDIASSHKELLQKHCKSWQRIYTNLTCLSCLARQPNHALSCHHSLCDSCVMIHGGTSLNKPWRFTFDTCPLCQCSLTDAFMLKPPTAGVRGLVIDGGSIQDADTLKSLERQLQLPMDIREHFDIAIESGIGALLMLEIFCKQWSIDECLHYSHTLDPSFLGEEVSAFDDGSTIKSNLMKTLLRSFHQRQKVASNNVAIITKLKTAFGQETKIFEASPGPKVAVVAVKSKSHSMCSFANYNRGEHRPELIRSHSWAEELSIWEIGRVMISQNAFLGYQFKELGDPNDLINTAFWDQDSLWSRSQRPLDTLFCLGSSVDASASDDHGWIYDYRIRKDRKDLIALTANSLIASLFYIELIGLPIPTGTGFFCRVLICCRLLPSHTAYQILVHRLKKTKAKFYFNGHSVACINRQLCNEVQQGIPFSKYVELTVTSTQSVIDIQLDGVISTRQSISNCPYVLQTLIEDQGLHCAFGSYDHRARYLG